MVSFTVRYDKDVLEALRADIAKAPQTIQVFASKTIPDLIRKEIKPLTTEPREPTLPFIWSYDPGENRRLRAAYFKKLPKGSRGGRYRRTHKLVQGWKVAAGSLKDGSVIVVSNDTPYLETVQGNQQYPSHADSGWAQYDDVLLKAEEKANDTLIEAWFGVLDSPASGSKFK